MLPSMMLHDYAILRFEGKIGNWFLKDHSPLHCHRSLHQYIKSAFLGGTKLNQTASQISRFFIEVKVMQRIISHSWGGR